MAMLTTHEGTHGSERVSEVMSDDETRYRDTSPTKAKIITHFADALAPVTPNGFDMVSELTQGHMIAKTGHQVAALTHSWDTMSDVELANMPITSHVDITSLGRTEETLDEELIQIRHHITRVVREDVEPGSDCDGYHIDLGHRDGYNVPHRFVDKRTWRDHVKALTMRDLRLVELKLADLGTAKSVRNWHIAVSNKNLYSHVSAESVLAYFGWTMCREHNWRGEGCKLYMIACSIMYMYIPPIQQPYPKPQRPITL